MTQEILMETLTSFFLKLSNVVKEREQLRIETSAGEFSSRENLRLLLSVYKNSSNIRFSRIFHQHSAVNSTRQPQSDQFRKEEDKTNNWDVSCKKKFICIKKTVRLMGKYNRNIFFKPPMWVPRFFWLRLWVRSKMSEGTGRSRRKCTHWVFQSKLWTMWTPGCSGNWEQLLEPANQP